MQALAQLRRTPTSKDGNVASGVSTRFSVAFRQILLALFVAVLFLAPVGTPQAKRAAASDVPIASSDFTIVTYNIADLSFKITVPHPVDTMAYYLAYDKPDIMAIQEDFDERLHSHITDWNPTLYPTYMHPDRATGFEIYNSGLTWFSKGEFLVPSYERVAWDHCSNGANFDCAAHKGFTHAIVRFSGMSASYYAPIHVFNIHTDAGRTNKDRFARENNLWQLKQYIVRNVPPSSPLIILGDYNLKRGDESDMDVLNRFKFLLALEQVDMIYSVGASLVYPVYDYVLYRSSLESTTNGYGAGLELLEAWSPNHYRGLSDHDPIFSKFKYTVYQDYTPSLPAASIKKPKNGVTFSSTIVDFEIDLGYAINPTLFISDIPNPNLNDPSDYLAKHFFQVGETKVTITGLPADGRTLYAWVKSFMTAFGEWKVSDTYTFYAFNEQQPIPVPAKLTNPPDKAELDDVEVLFQWTTGEYLDEYRLLIEKENGSDIFDYTAYPPNTSVWVDDLPHKGQNLYVTLESYSGGVLIGTDNSVLQAVNIPDPVEDNPPFGALDTPNDGAEVSGSIPVTGWALDDTEVRSVKIFRDSGIYIGDAVFVKGARPDVETAYPDYPNNDTAGWGYLLLTNALPGGGNGNFTLYAVATDNAGKQTTLGTVTITANNNESAAPFGAIDTPTQGGIASGTHYVVWGWALTPQPNKIPEDGSTITVWIDNIPVGHPTYNIFRQDVYNAFPDYANSGDPDNPESGGPVGYFYLDTTQYVNGTHTISWSVRDDAGNSAGIGSRYFTIDNPPSAPDGGSLTVTSPNGNELLEMGHNRVITWNASGITSGIEIMLYQDDVYVGNITTGTLDPASGSYTWNVGTLVDSTGVPLPEAAEEDVGYVIRISEIGTGISDDSDEPFYLVSPSLLLKSSTGGFLAHGSLHKILWEPAFLTADVNIFLWKDGVWMGAIATDLDQFDFYSNQGSYLWTVGTLANGTSVPPGSGYTIKVREKGVPLARYSEPFTISDLNQCVCQCGTSWELKASGGATSSDIHLQAVANNGSRWVAVGDLQSRYSDDGGDTWVTDSPFPNYAKTITYANEKNIFVAAGNGGFISTSTDGENWVARNSPVSTDILGSAYGAGMYVLVGQSGNVVASPDGVSWIHTGNAGTANISALTFGDGTFVACTATGWVYTSMDASTWVNRGQLDIVNAKTAVFGGGVFLIGGQTSAGKQVVYRSTDGVSWTKHVMPWSLNSGYVYDITYTGTEFIGIAGSWWIIKSSNGSTWTNQASPATRRILYGIDHSCDEVIAVGSSGILIRTTCE